jgi:G:T-mismatch repair DNA endonuclease (very short patch repair protein)
MAIDWLKWEAKNTGQHIRHQGNDSEKLIGMKRIPVDGFCRDTNSVYEFQGCILHGHRCWMTKKHNGVNPVNGKSLDDLYQRTRDKIQYIKDQGYNVMEMWKCQWQASIKRDSELSRFIENRKRSCDGLVTMTEDQILTAVMDEKLFGALEVDLHVPDDMKSQLAEMPPIFKNIEVSRDDIEDHMKTYAEERNVMNQPRKSLIGSIYGEKVMVISPLLKWYVEHGLKVTQIHQVVEYKPATCFQKFGEQVSEARRAGDGNSSYGKTVMMSPIPDRILWCYGEYQPLYETIRGVEFRAGLPILDTLDPEQRNLIIIDDLMDETDQRMASLFTKKSHHRNISVMYIVQNLFHKGKYHRTISLNAHYMVLFKNSRDVSHIYSIAQQMFPRNTTYMLQAFAAATSEKPHGYLLIDMKQQTVDRLRLRSHIFPGEKQTVYLDE